MKFAYICTNYNNSHFTIDAVESLRKTCQAKGSATIVVVDNNSTPDQKTLLASGLETHKNATIIFNSLNEGYFQGLNIGLDYLLNHHPDVRYAVIGNNDLLFPPDFCDRIAQKRTTLDSHPVTSPAISTLDGDAQNPHVIERISMVREVIYDLYYMNYSIARAMLTVARLTRRLTGRRDHLQHQVRQLIRQGHGSCYILGPTFFHHFKTLWAPTFLMGEEFFLSKQLADKGFLTFYEPDIRVTHRYHGSLEDVPSRQKWEYARRAHKIYRQYVHSPLTRLCPKLDDN
jgi:hypothetical protein